MAAVIRIAALEYLAAATRTFVVPIPEGAPEDRQQVWIVPASVVAGASSIVLARVLARYWQSRATDSGCDHGYQAALDDLVEVLR